MNRLKLSLELSGYEIFKCESFVRKLPHSTSIEYSRYMEKQLWEIFNYYKVNNKRYSSFVGDKNIVKWTDVPLLTKDVLKVELDSWITGSFDKSKLFHNHTSGSSSGQPFHIYKDKKCHGITWSEIIEMYSNLADIEIGKDMYGRFMGISPDSSRFRARVKDFFANRITYDTFNLNDDLFEKATNDIKLQKVKYLYGYASAIYLYARYLLANPSELIKIKGLLKAVIVTSEMCRSSDFQLIKNVFEVPVFNEYGCSEFGVLAVGQTLDELEIWGRHLWIEVVDDEGNALPDGVHGRIVVTSLYNYAFPFIRFDIGDIAAIVNRDGKRYLTNLQGRSNERFELADGTMISVLSIEFAIDQIYDCCPALMEYQLVFVSPQECCFKYVASQNCDGNTNSRIASILHNFMGESQKVSVVQVDAIPRGAAGKSKNILKTY